jgi:hypothetical protein
MQCDPSAPRTARTHVICRSLEESEACGKITEYLGIVQKLIYCVGYPVIFSSADATRVSLSQSTDFMISTMEMLQLLSQTNSLSMIGTVILACILLQILYTRYYGGLSAIPGPFSASFCNYWRVVAVYKSDMPKRNMAVHKKYGPVVRIGPKHVSFASPEALVTIHGSRQAYPKVRDPSIGRCFRLLTIQSDFYKQTVATWEGKPLQNLFSAQDVNWHSSLKKTIGGLYTKSAVLGLEPKIDACMHLFTEKIKDLTKAGTSSVDMSLWIHLFTFDCLGDINVSRNFGFLENGKDVNGMIAGSDALLIMTGLVNI